MSAVDFTTAIFRLCDFVPDAEQLIQDGDAAGFRTALPRLSFLSSFHLLSKRIILEGLKTPVRSDCLKEMLRLLLEDPRIARVAKVDFFADFEIGQDYSSFNAVSFWNALKELAPESHILHPGHFLSFLLLSSSEACSDEEISAVNECVSDLIHTPHTPLHLSIHHPFFSVIYPHWNAEDQDHDELLLICLSRYSRFHADNLALMLLNGQVSIPSAFFPFVLQRQRFDLGSALLDCPRAAIATPQEPFSIPQVSVMDPLFDEKVDKLCTLLQKLNRCKHVPPEALLVYLPSLMACLEDLTDSSEEEPPQKRPRLQ